jgi:hypothetical protein
MYRMRFHFRTRYKKFQPIYGLAFIQNFYTINIPNMRLVFV